MSSNEVAISAVGLGKSYSIVHHDELPTTLVGAAMRRLRRPLRRPARETFWALRDVSFEVRPGEVVGIIGRNGAGKSTLLKILSRITVPTVGEADLFGRVGSLLEVGTGFNPELTGRENIFLNGSILGMRREEIRRHFDAIVDFSGIERFLDTPVKRYSSGMYVRLAFAVAAHLTPEIMIVDEVLAVGDADFQKKCLGKMSEVSRQGRTVLFVSHNMHAVLNLCSRALLLESGRVVLDDRAERVIELYHKDGQQSDMFVPERGRRSGDRRARIAHFEVLGRPETGSPAAFAFDIDRPADDTWPLQVELAVDFLTDQGVKLVQLFSQHMGRTFDLPPGRSRVVAAIDRLPLAPGSYLLNLWMGSGYQSIDMIEDCYTLGVAPGRFHEETYIENRGFPVVLPSTWDAEPALGLVGPGPGGVR